MPKVKATFVCPTYNGAGYLAETIDSIIAQTVEDWELIVIDDASTDTTKRLMEWYKKHDKRIRYLRLGKNSGSAAQPRNTGNAMANGKIILVIDHDDLCNPDRLKYTLAHFEKHPDTNVFHGGWVECTIHGIPQEQFRPSKITRKGYEAVMAGQGDMLFCHSTAAYTKKFAVKYPYPEANGMTDDLAALDLWTQKNRVFRTSNRVLCGVRRLPMGQMQQIRAMKGLPPSVRV
jgi:glycosyltransferase involved in cell wall biosynthesis